MMSVLNSTETELKENSQEDFDLYNEMILVLNYSAFELSVQKWLFKNGFLFCCFCYAVFHLGHFLETNNIIVTIYVQNQHQSLN